MTMIGKMAQAIHDALYDRDSDGMVETAAHACLAALLEPTEAMVEAGRCDGDAPYALETWHRMIRAALEEK